MAVRLLPSVTKIVVAWLRASADMQALVSDRVGTSLYAGTSPTVQVTHVTGEERVRQHLIAQMIDVKSYGGTPDDAELVALTAHDVLHQMIGSRTGGSVPDARRTGVVTAVRCLTMPSWNPDEGFTPARPRYLGTYELTLHPSPA